MVSQTRESIITLAFILLHFELLTVVYSNSGTEQQIPLCISHCQSHVLLKEYTVRRKIFYSLLLLFFYVLIVLKKLN